MAKKQKRITDLEPNEPRTDVKWRYIGLISAFAILFVVSIFTVMIPELTDDGAEEEAEAAGLPAEAAAPPATDVPVADAPPAAP